ncbi:MAG: rod shape-determining protein RodA [Limnochordia bacterium]|nr:rod shape-determining protein RodA [Limnochordia bacterium]MDI9464959.1 rod shape-determining protein RodA [Bacillota bacterium]NLO96431.1 rod shape-determining protein RodA [Bacillota bacterium]HOK32743.1 rod shape-determining protein RodA [Limnochordia bacterium]HOM00668.1 rod shape-determining protein RodA [Limnochordia bacterium]
MNIPRRYWRNLDWPLILAVLCLTAIGMVVIYSASYSQLEAANLSPFYYVRRQALAFGLGLVLAIVIISLDYRTWKPWSRLIYLATILLLGTVLIFGHAVFGSQRWVRLGPLSLQPSELAKITLVLALAKLFEKEENGQSVKGVVQAALLTLIPMALIIVQPDLGTAVIFVGLFFTMWYVGNARLKTLLIAGLVLVVVAAGLIVASLNGWLSIIKPYQLTRLLVFLNPYADRDGAGWNVIQSIIAIGSGGFLGKGIRGGTQSSLHFLPANHTDFVFSVIAEEFGFLGALVVVGLFLLVIWRGLRIAAVAKDTYGTLLAAGATSIFFFHLIINVGMALGMMPVTGLPLPFITAGGSTMITSLMAVAIILNVGLRRSKIMF